MAHTANHSVPEQGKFRRALGAVWTFLQAMESTSFDYTLDRIERLEREVGRLKEETPPCARATCGTWSAASKWATGKSKLAAPTPALRTAYWTPAAALPECPVLCRVGGPNRTRTKEPGPEPTQDRFRP